MFVQNNYHHTSVSLVFYHYYLVKDYNKLFSLKELICYPWKASNYDHKWRCFFSKYIKETGEALRRKKLKSNDEFTCFLYHNVLITYDFKALSNTKVQRYLFRNEIYPKKSQTFILNEIKQHG